MNLRSTSAPIERFGWFEPWLARGAQPSRDDLQWLKSQGIRIVVNLRERDLRRDVEAAGLRGVHIPVKNDSPPDEAQVLQWLAICAKHAGTDPIFVHCAGGEGRTSVFCAAVRLAQGADVETAIAEQLPYGFKPEEEHAAQEQFLRAFAQRVRTGMVQLPPLPRS